MIHVARIHRILFCTQQQSSCHFETRRGVMLDQVNAIRNRNAHTNITLRNTDIVLHIHGNDIKYRTSRVHIIIIWRVHQIQYDMISFHEFIIQHSLTHAILTHENRRAFTTQCDWCVATGQLRISPFTFAYINVS